MNARFTLFASASLFAGVALAADVTVTPPAGGQVVINAAPATPALVVQPDQQVRLPGLPGAASYTDGVCHDASGKLGRCNAVPTVVTSGWFKVPAAIDAVFDNSNVKQTQVNLPLLTGDVISKNDFRVYMDWGQGVVPLPHTSYAAGKVSTVSYRIVPGKLYIWRFTHDNSASDTVGASVDFRYVMTPRGALGDAPTP